MKTKRKSTVTRITLARLYNTGNYEHVRYEITAEVPRGGSAKQTLLDLGAILARLKPLRVPYNYDTAKATIQKLPEALTEQEKKRIEEFGKIVAEFEGLKALRREAIAKLDDVGGSSKHTDAKASWSDDEDAPF